MLVPLGGGGGTAAENSLMSPMTQGLANTSTDNMRAPREITQEDMNRERSSQNISGNRKRDATTPLDLTKSQAMEMMSF